MTIIKDLRRVARAMDLDSKKLSLQNGLTAPQILSLLAIYEARHDMTLAKVADEVHLSASTMVGIIDRLEKKGLVVRERSTTDRRQVMVSITNEGKKVVKKTPIPLEETLLGSLNHLSENQQKQLVDALALLIRMLE